MKLNYNMLCLISIICTYHNIFSMDLIRKQILSPHHVTTFKSVIKKNRPFEQAVPKIKMLGKRNPEWKRILSSEQCMGKLIQEVAKDWDTQPEFVAAVMTSPGSTKWGKKYITLHPEAYENLHLLLIDVTKWSQEKLAWENEDLDICTAILNMGVSANAIDKGDIIYAENAGATAITSAATHNKKALVELFLKHGAPIESKSPWDGRTALMAAALYGHNDILKFLINQGANVNATNCLGKTALLYASNKAHLETVRILIAHGANLNICDEDKKTPLKEARQATFSQYKEHYQAIEQMLIKAGATE